MAQPGYSGWGELGEILAGGGGTPGAYEKQLGVAYDTQKKGYSRDEAMEKAAFERNLNIARGAGLVEKLQSVLGDEQGGLVAQILQGNRTMDLGQVDGYSRPGYLDAANIVARGTLGDPAPVVGTGEALGEDEMYARSLGAEVPELEAIPDIPAVNRARALMAEKDYQPTRVLGGAFVPDGMTVDNFEAVPTPEVLSRIEKNATLGDAATIRANRAPASGAKGAKAATTASAEASELAKARAAVQSGADPGQVADLLRRRGFPGLAKKIYSPGGG